MAGSSSQLNFLSQIQYTREELNTNFDKLLLVIHLLQTQLVGQLQKLEDGYHQEMEEEVELKRLVKHLSNTGGRNHPGNRINSINNQIQQMLSQSSSKLLVIDWDLSIIQHIKDKFCKISVNNLDSTLHEDSLTSSIHELTISKPNPCRPCLLPQETKLCPDLSVKYSRASNQQRSSLSLEQKYKDLSLPSRFSDSISRKGGRNIPRGDGQPIGILVSGDLDRVYITSQGRNSVQSYKLNGIFLKEVTHYGASCGEFNNPAGITMDSTERLYVCVRGSDRVVVFSKTLVFITVLTSQLTNPIDVAIVGNEVAILHHGEYCVSFFTRGGKFLREAVKHGSNKQKVSHPLFFCINSRGNILITDTENDCIKMYRDTGYHLYNIESINTPAGEFIPIAGISGIALFDDGTIVALCNEDDDQIQILKISATQIY